MWRLKLYVNGNGPCNNSHISAYIEVLKGLYEPMKYQYYIELVLNVH